MHVIVDERQPWFGQQQWTPSDMRTLPVSHAMSSHFVFVASWPGGHDVGRPTQPAVAQAWPGQQQRPAVSCVIS